MSHRSHLSSLEAQLSTATHELELATFLNKGILQTNTEYKLRIGELESENAILRTAEGKLGDMEDLLEEREKEMEELRAEVERGEEQRERMEADVGQAIERRETVDKERDEAVRELYEERRGREYWERRYAELAVLTDQYCTQIRKARGEYAELDVFGSRGALPSVPSSLPKERGNKHIPAGNGATSSSSKKPRQPNTTSSSASRPSGLKSTHPPIASSESPQYHSLQNTSSPPKRPVREAVKKRRRIAESDDEYEEEQAEEYIPSLPRGIKQEPVDQTPSRQVQPPAQRVPFSSKSTKSRNNPTHSDPRKRTAGENLGPAAKIKVKKEPVNRRYESTEEDTDDDPL
ncbi:hypothetical protein B9479_002201 [Cryptococcus floricola]|uniref:Uncharacterized protein n=1 Tax=Cryptococcus floricola TaxID=2591691 RepID=A0A5D3B4J4_9TREE|nr:hypothetical protein B9479_002201 [Cryptococcus floricola]